MTTYFNDKKIANVNSLQRFEKYCKNRVPEINKKYNLIWNGNEIITNDTGRISSSNRIHSYMSIWMSKDEPLLHRMIFFMVTYCEYRKVAKNYSIKFKYDKDNTIFMNYFTYLLARINIPYFAPDVALFKHDETFLSSVCVKKTHWRTAEKILSASSGYMLKFHFECKFDEYLIVDWDSSDRFQLALQFYHNFERNELIDCEIFGRIYARMLWNISTESENLIMIQKKFKLPNEIIFLILDHYELNYRQSFQFFRFKGKGKRNSDRRFAVDFPIVGQSESWSL